MGDILYPLFFWMQTKKQIQEQQPMNFRIHCVEQDAGLSNYSESWKIDSAASWNTEYYITRQNLLQRLYQDMRFYTIFWEDMGEYLWAIQTRFLWLYRDDLYILKFCACFSATFQKVILNRHISASENPRKVYKSSNWRFWCPFQIFVLNRVSKTSSKLAFNPNKEKTTI